MNLDSAWTAIIISTAGAVIVHVITAVWWASKINTTLGFLQEAIKTFNATLASHDADKYTIKDATKDFSIRDQQITALWKRIDELKGK